MNNYQHLLRNLKAFPTKNNALVLVYDILFWLVASFLGVLSGDYLKNFAQNLPSTIPSIAGGSIYDLPAPFLHMRKQVIFIIIFVLLYLVLLFLLWTLSRSFMWSTLTNKPWTKRYWGKMTLHYLTWFVIFVLPLGVIFNWGLQTYSKKVFAVQTAYVLGVVFLLFFFFLFFFYNHFVTLFYYHYQPNQKWTATFKLYPHGFSLIKKALPANGYLVLLVVVLSLLSFILRIFPETIASYVSITLMFLFFHFVRFHYLDVLRHIDKKHNH